MAPAKFDLNMYRGDTYTWRFKLWQDSGRTDPTNLSGAVITAQVRDKPDGVVVVTMPLVITLPNIIDMSMTADLYAGFPAKGVWDLEVKFPDGQIKTPLGGSTNVTVDVTVVTEV